MSILCVDNRAKNIRIVLLLFFFFKKGLANCSRTMPLFTNYSRTYFFLGFVVNTVREEFTKVSEQCSPNPHFRLFGEHCSWTFCQSSWTMFDNPPFCTFRWTLIVNSLPKFVNIVCQNQLVKRFGEHCSRTVITWLITKIFTNFLVIT